MENETINCNVLFVGCGPANLASAIHLMTLAQKQQMNLEVIMIEKGAEPGSHAMSGAILNPIALKELLPDYLSSGFPFETQVDNDDIYLLTHHKYFRLPFIPRAINNHQFYVISLSKFVKWLAQIAENLGINIFPGFSGTDILLTSDKKTIRGVRTGDKGRDKSGHPKGNFEPGVDILSDVTVFGEGAHGNLFQQAATQFNLLKGKTPQLYEIGMKEIIEVSEEQIKTMGMPHVIHTLGYPLDIQTSGGGFIYQMANNRLALGLLISLSYSNPMLDIYNAWYSFKKHPFIHGIIKNGKVIEFGARTVCIGGAYCLPELTVNGGVFVGNSASFHYAPGLKGIHTSMKSGMMAAEAIITAFQEDNFSKQSLNRYQELVNQSWIKNELNLGRNTAQALGKKAIPKTIHLLAQQITKGKGLIDPLRGKLDACTLTDAQSHVNMQMNSIPSYDDTLMIAPLTDIYLSKTRHREDQPCHIIINDIKLCAQCISIYNAPCTRFCPGKVYELDSEDNTPKIKLNPSNCLHCKTCEIKDPYKNITWRCPEGGDGPLYSIV